MENFVEKITQYLPKIEEFLTSVLLEETTVTITESEIFNAADNFDALGDEDIYLFSFDKVNNMDVITILDKEWFGLLSSIMLGIEEKTFNDKTIDLLKNFSSELKTALQSVLSDEGIEVDVDEIIPMKHSQVTTELHHT